MTKTLLPFRWEQRLCLKARPGQLAGAIFGVMGHRAGKAVGGTVLSMTVRKPGKSEWPREDTLPLWVLVSSFIHTEYL